MIKHSVLSLVTPSSPPNTLVCRMFAKANVITALAPMPFEQAQELIENISNDNDKISDAFCARDISDRFVVPLWAEKIKPHQHVFLFTGKDWYYTCSSQNIYGVRWDFIQTKVS